MHRLSALKSTNVARFRRGFAVARIARNVEAVTSSTTPSTSLPEIYGRVKKSIAGVSLQREREVPAALADLDDRVRALEVAADGEEAIVHEATYTEQELASFYEDVLANPFEDESQLRVNEEMVRKARSSEDAVIVEEMYERFDVDGDASTSKRPYLTILSRLESILSRLEAVHRITSDDSVTDEQQNFPISILSARECEALVRVTLKNKDSLSAELILKLMKKTGLAVPENAINDVLQVYAHIGNISGAESVLARYLTSPPADTQRHLHIQAHLSATPLNVVPTSALEVLHSYENQAIPAPMRTYTSVITSLFSRSSSIARAQAWDLFSHMRYVAHPDPDVLLYTLMIRACASPLSSATPSEVEKALDLWTEMTIDHRLTPTVGAYNAVILACARGGTKEYVGEAFRIARQMLDSHRNAQGVSAYRPDRKTFAALLEGAKRIGDLGRVRWILAELTRNQEGLESLNAPVDSEVDEEIMVHVFNAYAAYHPPFVRATTKLVKASSQLPSKSASGSSGAESTDTTTNDVVQQPGAIAQPTSFAHIPPQTHGEVVQEVDFLFRCIKESKEAVDPEGGFPRHKFHNVNLTPRLVSAYLSVLYHHSSLRQCQETFWSIYGDLKLNRTVRAYVEALERCANAKKNRDSGRERALALTFGEELWQRWAVIEGSGQFEGRKLDARMVERANVAMIRVLTLNDEIDRALDLVRTFAARYKPQVVSQPQPKPTLRSTRTILVGSRPLVRMTSPTDVPDDFVPPILTFKDIEVLHHRLVADGRPKDIGYLKWLVKAYEWALRVRRDESFKSVPPKDDRSRLHILAAS